MSRIRAQNPAPPMSTDPCRRTDHSYLSMTLARKRWPSTRLAMFGPAPRLSAVAVALHRSISSTLKNVYNYDNQNFIDYLISKGFYVATKSQSNYPMTFLSLASSLNMKYLNYLTDLVGIESEDPTLPYQMIKDSKVMNFLTKYMFKSE